MRIPVRTILSGTLALAAALSLPAAWAEAQQPTSHLTIPYLANTTTPKALDYAAAQCDLAGDGRSMNCRFRQVFITQSSLDPTLCAIVSNGYEKTFRRESDTRWVSVEVPDGTCGVVEETTLDDGGGTRWTMTLASKATRNVDTSECRALPQSSETYDWKSIKRQLPCTTIQPGAIER